MYLSRHAIGRSARSRPLLVAVIASLLLVPACSGGEQEDTATGDATPDVTAVQSEPADVDAAGSETSEAPDAPSADNEGGQDEGDESAEGGGEVRGIDLNADYCEIATQAEELGVFSGEGPETPDDLTTAAEQTRQITNAMVRQAPDEIADDVKVSARSLSDLLSVLEAQASRSGEVGPDAADDPDVQAAIDGLDSKKVQVANDRVHKWRRENC